MLHMLLKKKMLIKESRRARKVEVKAQSCAYGYEKNTIHAPARGGKALAARRVP
jgi:hypothetical protein